MAYGRLDHGCVLLTGATGFLGQAVLERLLADRPGVDVVLLVRGRRGMPADERVRGLLRKPCFGTWREREGDAGVERAIRERLDVVEADITHEVPDLPDDLTAVIHCASLVSFDPPIDEAFQTNLRGPLNLYEGVRRGRARPHLVHVSTAYVAGDRKGVVPEAPLDHTVDWRGELQAALAARDAVELGSRRPEVLRRCLDLAGREHRRAGPQAVASHAEERRRALVAERLVECGRLRAQSLGWPDVYTFTKALGERAIEESCTDLPLSVVRPAIVESALRTPYPGWLDGFKMADPIILAYGRGTIPEFPGVADGVLDLIPVDLVANSLLAVAANPPEPGAPHYFHVGSGARNPLTFQRNYDLLRQYFETNPLPDSAGRGEVRVPQWTFPGSQRVERMLSAAERVADLAEEALLRLPANQHTRGWMSNLQRKQHQLEFLRRYADLYGIYLESEVIYSDRATLALHRSMPAAEQEAAGFDTAIIDWRHYLHDIHYPSITSSLRRPSSPPRRRPVGAAALPRGDGTAAVFDLEGTILASNLVETYLWACLLDLPKARWPRELLSLAAALPKYLLAEHHGRGDFLRAFLRRYEGASEAGLHRIVQERLADQLLRRAWPAAIRRVRGHRAAGHRTLLITGTVDLLVEPLAGLFDEVAASRLHVVEGRCSGHLDRPPLVGEARAAWLRRWAADARIDLAKSWAYADDYSDRPLLEAVGHPVAVNPDPHLYRHARRKRWQVENWDAHAQGPVAALFEAVQAAAT